MKKQRSQKSRPYESNGRGQGTSALDQKTFLFNEFVPVYSGAFVPNLEPIDIQLNVGANGWSYRVSSP